MQEGFSSISNKEQCPPYLLLFHVVLETFSCQEKLMEMDVHLAWLYFPKLSSFVSGEMGVSAESSRSAS